MLNSCSIIGRLVVNPELKTTGAGTKFVKGRVAITRDIPKNNGKPNGQGYKEYDTDFIPFCIWNNGADFASTLIKGQMLCLQGRWQTSQYTDQAGNKQTGHELNVTSFYVLDKKNQDNNDSETTSTPDNNSQQNSFQPQNNGFTPPAQFGQGQPSFQPQNNGFTPPAQFGFNQPTNF